MSKRNSAIATASSLTIFAEEAYELKMLGREKPELSPIYCSADRRTTREGFANYR